MKPACRHLRAVNEKNPRIVEDAINVAGPALQQEPYALAKGITIVGVMGPGFSGISSPWSPTQVWVPLVQWYAVNGVADPKLRNWDIHYADCCCPLSS